ncbi:MAG: hypothetical protein WAS05_06955 [Candidatus Nanopelagicales bacterium]
MQTVLSDSTDHTGSEAADSPAQAGGRRTLKALLLGLVATALTLSLAGCFNGMNAGTQQVGASGDGVNADIGSDATLQVRNMVWVRDKNNPKNLTLSGAFNNVSKNTETLTEVVTNPKGAVTITGGKLEIPGVSDGTGSSVRVGYNADKYIDVNGVDVVESGYVATTFKFTNAGSETLSILVVPPTGDYADVKSK